MEKAKKLIKEIDNKITNWNERSQFTIKGVKNLSRSDLDTIVLYAETFIKFGGNGFPGLMKPRGNVEQVLSIYEIV